MVTDDSQTYGDNSEMYRNMKSLCGVPGIHIVLEANYTLQEASSQQNRNQVCGSCRHRAGLRALDEGGPKRDF